MFPSKFSSPASIFVLPRDAAADFKTKFLESTRRGEAARTLLQKYVTRGRYSFRPVSRRVSRIHISLPREKPAHYTSRALLPFSNVAPAFSGDGAGGVAGEGNRKEKEKEKEIARSAATRMFIDRRSAIVAQRFPLCPELPRGAKGWRRSGGGGGEREKEKSRKEMIENHL